MLGSIDRSPRKGSVGQTIQCKLLTSPSRIEFEAITVVTAPPALALRPIIDIVEWNGIVDEDWNGIVDIEYRNGHAHRINVSRAFMVKVVNCSTISVLCTCQRHAPLIPLPREIKVYQGFSQEKLDLGWGI